MDNQLTNLSYGNAKAQQLHKSFNNNTTRLSAHIDLMKSWGYDDEESELPLIFNDETPQGLIKGKLDTSHLVLKDVSVKGVMQKRWVDPNKDNQEHAEHGSTVEFEHKGEKKTGTVGSVTKTGEYAIKAHDGKMYNKHPHQFDSPHANRAGAEDHAKKTDDATLKKFAENDKADPKLKDIAQKELSGRNQGQDNAGGDKKDTNVKKLDDEGDSDNDINAKFKTYEKFVRMTAKGLTKSTIAYGGGGVGKTYTAMQQLKKMINPSTGQPFVFYDPKKHDVGSTDYDVVKITGKATTTGLYKTMFQHNDKLLIFDDCDEVLKDPNSVNMFKGALDSTGDGTINNLSGRAIKDDSGEPIPQTYTFGGRAIFISNLTSAQMPQPLKSRSLRIDLSMNAQQTIDRIKEISKNKEGKLTNIELQDVNNKPIKYDHEDMDKAIKFMEKYKNKMGDLNVRTLGSLVKIIHDNKSEGDGEDDWQTTAKHFVFSKGFNAMEDDISKAFSSLGVFEKGGVGSGRHKIGTKVGFKFGVKNTPHSGKIIEVHDNGEYTIKPSQKDKKAFGQMQPKIHHDKLSWAE